MARDCSRENASYFVVLIMIQMHCSSGRKREEVVDGRSGDCRWAYLVRTGCARLVFFHFGWDANHAVQGHMFTAMDDKKFLLYNPYERTSRRHMKDCKKRLQASEYGW